jgi:D-xylose transport system permease protein
VSEALPAGAPPPADERLDNRSGLLGYVDQFTNKVRSGELGALPVVVGLVIIVAIFQSLNDIFLSSFNLVSIAQFIAATGIISIGVVLVLLLGEIDLSVGAVSGAAAAALAILHVNHGFSAGLAIASALVFGALIGLLHGLVFTKLGVPSFVVTLAGLLIWQGAQLRILGSTGSVNLPPNGFLIEFGQRDFLNADVGYVLATVAVVGVFLAQWRSAAQRRSAELPARPLLEIAIRNVALLLLLWVAVWLVSGQPDRAVPYILLLFLVLVFTVDWVLRRTRYGRTIYAIGGNIEAARRAGINVDAVRTSVFVLASMFAALGGIVGASYLGSVNQQTGGGDTLINAIAAAVIGGTSLFGGRGRAQSALLGMLVIGAIANGLLLQNLRTEDRYMITGAVLLASVVIDALARRGRQTTGR